MRKVKLGKIDKKTFDAILKSENKNILLLGSEESNCFWEVNLENISFINKKILLKSYNYGIEPEAILLNENLLGIGVESIYFLIYGDENIKEIKLPSLFHDVLWGDQKKVLIKDEISFLVVSLEDGNIVWKQDTDLLNSYEIKGNMIYYETFEGEKGEISIPFLTN